ncbi:MAG: hypothetical protein CM15mV126_060 [uncultured marine virus]|nr:MAG: hypothetical protein CM15mV126_060 [uncultured marine virus]
MSSVAYQNGMCMVVKLSFHMWQWDTAVVEDCASACAVSEDYAGVALMGTSLPTEYNTIKNKFDNILCIWEKTQHQKHLT